jgi:hypothetical protein
LPFQSKDFKNDANDAGELGSGHTNSSVQK